MPVFTKPTLFSIQFFEINTIKTIDIMSTYPTNQEQVTSQPPKRNKLENLSRNCIFKTIKQKHIMLIK